MLTECHGFQVIGSVLAVNQIRVSIKLFCFNTHTVRSVLHQAVTEAAVTHLRNERHILLALFFIVNLTAVQSHQAHKLFNLRRHQQGTNVLLPSARVISVPGLSFCTVAGIVLIALTEQVSHTCFIPGISSGVLLIWQFRVCVLDVVHFLTDFLRRDIASIGKLKQFISHFLSHLPLSNHTIPETRGE